MVDLARKVCLAVLAVIAVAYAIGTLPSPFHLPKVEGKASATVDMSQLVSAFVSQQGIDAGSTTHKGLKVHVDQETISGLSSTALGRRFDLEADGIVRYHSDFSKLAPYVAADGSLVLPTPTPESVTITTFHAIQKDRWSGLLQREDPDVQLANRKLQQQLCELSVSYKADINDRQVDAKAAADKFAAARGLPTVPIEFQAVERTPLPECKGNQ